MARKNYSIQVIPN